MGRNILGCRMRYNRIALGETHTPFSLECSVSWNVSSIEDINNALQSTLSILSSWLHIGFRPAEPPRWEYLGRRFNLYVYKIESSRGVGGETRIVESGSKLLCIAGVFSKYIEEHLDSSLLEEFREKRVIEYGDNISDTYFLRRPPAGETIESQKRIPSFVVYAAEGIQDVDPSTWRLRIRGEVAEEKEYSLDELYSMAEDLGSADFHCVTGWSVSSKKWIGVRISKLIEDSKPTSRAKWVVIKSVRGGYSTIIPLEEALRDNAFAVLRVDGEPLSREHGYPLRLFFPRLFGWKSAKWVNEIILLDRYEDGTWEARAYHERGLVEYEERFKIRNPDIVEEGRLVGKPRPLRP